MMIKINMVTIIAFLVAQFPSNTLVHMDLPNGLVLKWFGCKRFLTQKRHTCAKSLSKCLAGLESLVYNIFPTGNINKKAADVDTRIKGQIKTDSSPGRFRS